MDSRPVPIRTSQSASDFWSRVRASGEVSPTGRVTGKIQEGGGGLPVVAVDRSALPFGKQLPASPLQSWRPMQRGNGGGGGGGNKIGEGSRFVERKALQRALDDADAENRKPQDWGGGSEGQESESKKPVQEALAAENALLKAEVRRLSAGLCSALKVNKALAAAMLKQQVKDAEGE